MLLLLCCCAAAAPAAAGAAVAVAAAAAVPPPLLLSSRRLLRLRLLLSLRLRLPSSHPLPRRADAFSSCQASEAAWLREGNATAKGTVGRHQPPHGDRGTSNISTNTSSTSGASAISTSSHRHGQLEYHCDFQLSHKYPPSLHLLQAFCDVALRPPATSSGAVANHCGEGGGALDDDDQQRTASAPAPASAPAAPAAPAEAPAAPEAPAARSDRAVATTVVAVCCRDGYSLCSVLACALLMAGRRYSVAKAWDVFNARRFASGALHSPILYAGGVGVVAVVAMAALVVVLVLVLLMAMVLVLAEVVALMELVVRCV